MLKGNEKLRTSAGLSVVTFKSKYDNSKNGSSKQSSHPYPIYFDANPKGPLEIHDEMKKQNMQNRIEIKTLDDEDFDEMNDCEIEVEAEDILPEEIKQESNIEYEKPKQKSQKGKLLQISQFNSKKRGTSKELFER